jgi:tRNA (guanine37-N1)-methyltransferase
LKKRLRQTLSAILSPEDLRKVYSSYDIAGDIAVFRLPCASSVNTEIIAKEIMNVHRNVKTVLFQSSPVAGDLRLRRLTYVSGENKTATIHREFGCLFAVDLSTCYFSPRLSHERMRIARLVEPGETLVNMFAGVGCFSIIAAKHSDAAKVFSIDVNLEAVRFMKENIGLNRVYNKVTPLMGDSKEIVSNRLQHRADRVLMPLPEKALEYLPSAVSTLKKSGGWIHYYGFEHAPKTESPIEMVKLKIAEALDALGVAFEPPFIRVVRSTGPNWFQLVADVHVV